MLFGDSRARRRPLGPVRYLEYPRLRLHLFRMSRGSIERRSRPRCASAIDALMDNGM